MLLKLVPNIISKGNVGMWGKTVNYIFYSDSKKYIFNTNGNLIKILEK